ncbi:hypothetical protein P775_14270 [Puniceibacterium antarcticum]|uniref:Uncharacterized protein n=1 Tax=Puniceibacterium antarcticum TaxID=1206336 RepID=A0A2G8RD64_9RHOB|nr:hypothetical protein [Puniceibacterium antarcticum]PIL19515.1 hypothetical protein P775_14270 [Puniceibacterium antarcticum]
MNRKIINIPPDLIRFTSVDWDIDWRGQSIGGNDGVDQVVFNRFPRWIGSPDMVLPGPQAARWRGIRAAAQGRSHVLRVPMIDPVAYDRLANVPRDVRERGLPFSTGERLSTGYGFTYDAAVNAVGDAPKGAELLQVRQGTHLRPVVGQIMSAADLPFIVTSVRDLGAGDLELGVQMPLRAAIKAGDRVSLCGWGLFELAGDMSARPEYGLSRVARPKLELVEWLR